MVVGTRPVVARCARRNAAGRLERHAGQPGFANGYKGNFREHNGLGRRPPLVEDADRKRRVFKEAAAKVTAQKLEVDV